MLDLFTDVPVRLKSGSEKSKTIRSANYSFNPSRIYYESHVLESHKGIGAASFLLHASTQSKIRRILLEGGPGQGKSTISQYVCQVHRARLLSKNNDIDSIPANLINSPIRLPIKIDLRHIAAWVENKNPYAGVINEEHFSRIWNKSLESFLVGHFFYHSKLEEFNSTDFVAVCKFSPLLFVFDGFDEIANFKVRKEVIEFINKGLSRIEENSKSIQVIITSRPSVFSESIGFAVDVYPHFELTNVTPEITKEYVAKWIKANRLNSKEAAEINRLVDEKLEMPHLKELAKSPMQLAIFISLLRTKGESLPNKRTALYDSYIELLFDRESEKSSFVRDNRDLIIDIHRYLAWVLHSEAELSKNSGSIRVEDLIALLQTYLVKEGHSTDITRLFDVVKDRVCALASRVQGTFEFEVQPLREYFCAKYLYNTSPYSPAGKEKKGALPDRFQGIARNFYWQNVVRFFAGCFSKGELAMLIQELKELQDDEILKYTNYPRILTAQLLSDYVFTQYPILMRPVVKVILDGINVGNIINQNENISHADPILIPIDCGRNEIVEECFKELIKFPSNYSELIGIIKNNPFNTVGLWSNYLSEFNGEQLTKWLRYGYLLGVIYRIEDRVLHGILREGKKKQIFKRMHILLNGNRIDVLCQDTQLKKLLFEGILDGKLNYTPKKIERWNSMEYLTAIINQNNIFNFFDKEVGNKYSFQDHMLQSSKKRQGDEFVNLDFPVDDEMDLQIKQFSHSIERISLLDLNVWKRDLDVWNSLVESGRKHFGDGWIFKTIANRSAGIRTDERRYEEYEDLHNADLDLCKRLRCARMKSGNIKYWEDQIERSNDIIFTLLVFFTWATQRTLIALLPKLSALISEINSDDFDKLIGGLIRSNRNYIIGRHKQWVLSEYLNENKIDDSIILLISTKYEPSDRRKFISEYVSKLSGKPDIFKNYKLDHLIMNFLGNITNRQLLNEIKLLYSDIESINSMYGRRTFPGNFKLPLDIAMEIMSDCKLYPGILVSMAELSCRIYASQNALAVGEIAKKGNWFGDN